ncbi:C14orf169 [Cordylochernes scorpioides]|uniref:Bifunctional lysine-specific demethylase and histidyl-hydroxylase n=1 Tax=Cordylochernes scorpioides TaxID=51811 RepID=A0ABY6LG68_9ARAC|nr:C14orf169 [Cordylochernes scorpioides]
MPTNSLHNSAVPSLIGKQTRKNAKPLQKLDKKKKPLVASQLKQLANSHSKNPSQQPATNSQQKTATSNNKNKTSDKTQTSKGYVKIVRELNQPTPKLPRTGKNCFQWMIDPVDEKEFFSTIWEQQPLLISRNDPNYYKKLFSSPIFNNILQKNPIQFTENLDITSYKDGKRETHNPEGRAYPAVVWDYYKNQGCSVRMLNPQTYSTPIWRLCSALQDYFHSFTGCNMYLTPPDSQGFAPHFDDIEAFVLQIEGSKLWKCVCATGNFNQNEIRGPPALTVALQPGDLLYFPRGWVHQAASCDGKHSLHLTISTYQQHSWATLLAAALPTALANIPYMRQGLPRSVFSQSPKELGEAASELLASLPPLDLKVGLDTLARNLLHSSLPPCLSPEEKAQSALTTSSKWGEPGPTFKSTTLIRLVRRHCCRVVNEAGQLRLYHNLANSRVYQEKEPQYVELEADLSEAIHFLNCQYPQWTPISAVPPRGDVEDKVYIANELFKQGILLAKNS